MKIRKKKLEPFFGDIMDVYYILEERKGRQGTRVLMGRMPFDGKDPCPGTFQIEVNDVQAPTLHLSSKDKDKHIRVVYYAQTVYQLDIPRGAKKIPMRVDKP